MFQSVQRSAAAESRVHVDMTPLIDIVFILLLFFLVTATFVRETGVRVNRPAASSAEPLDSDTLRVTLTESGGLYVQGARISATQLKERVRAASLRDPRTVVVLIPDAAVNAGRLVRVIDAARLGGAYDVAIATVKEDG